ncbi:MAG: protein translocase subunit SecD [Gemmatimonadaceae bacterium]|nr:protein translocase subunit SecD [Gemmatimonadaceae bacterium]
MNSLRSRLLLIAAAIALSVFALFPRATAVRERQPDGSFVETTKRLWPLKYGLDLQGGMHLALEIDESKGAVADKKDALNLALKTVRNRIDQFGVSEPTVQLAGDDRIIVELPGIDDQQRAQDVVQKSAFLQFQITDETNALEKSLPRMDAAVRSQRLDGAASAPTANAAKPSAAAPLSGLLTGDTTRKVAVDSGKAAGTETAARVAAADTAVKKDANGPVTKLVQPGQFPGQYFVKETDVARMTRYLADSVVRAAVAPGKVIRFDADTLVGAPGQGAYRAMYVLDSKPIITGDYLTDAKPNNNPLEGGYIVEFEFNAEGGRIFRRETGRHIRDNMAVVLDDRVMTAPTINSAIGRNGQITLGGAGLQEAQDLALVLRAGKLPVPLKVADMRSIGASLGQDSIDKGALAFGIAIALVIAIMIGYYRFSGMIACVALALYIFFTLAALAGFGATLTLPGIAGLVLGVGIAVDANVLIFERIREEMDRGKSARLSIEEGFKHALSAIVDTSVATILSGAVLYQYGTGPVRGFAVTLVVGVAASLFTAIFVTRTLLLLWLDRTGGTKPLSI